MSGQPADDCPDHQKEGRPNVELAPLSAAKAVMRCGVDLGPNFTEGGNVIGNSFHAMIIPPRTLKRSPRFGGNEPFLGRPSWYQPCKKTPRGSRTIDSARRVHAQLYRPRTCDCLERFSHRPWRVKRISDSTPSDLLEDQWQTSDFERNEVQGI
jgi:hypothetical protein